jgi:hypothetical protein
LVNRLPFTFIQSYDRFSLIGAIRLASQMCQ